MSRLIDWLIYKFGVTNVERATRKLYKTVNNLQKVVDRQQVRATRMADLAKVAAERAVLHEQEAARAGKIKLNLNNLFAVD
jgi:hypothetical protein